MKNRCGIILPTCRQNNSIARKSTCSFVETVVINCSDSTYSVFIRSRKFVKNEKSVRENIARMSSKPLYRVQEEVASLKQLLSVVATGLQRNASAIDKLKMESVQVDMGI